MAGSTKTITLKFTGDVDDLFAKVGEADGALKLLNKSAGNTDGFDKLSKDSGKAADDVTEKWAGTAQKWTAIVVGALGVGAPLVAAAATAMGVAAVAAVGVALVKGSDDVKNSWNDLTQTFLNEGQQSASVITGPISTALDDLSTLVVQEKPNLDKLFSGVATDIPPLESGLESLVNGAMPGLVSLFQNSKPIIDGVGTVLGAVGNAVGTVFQDISNNAPLIKKDLDDLAPTIQNLGSILGNLITIGSNVGTVVNPALTGLSTLLNDVTEIVSGQYAPKYDYNNPIFGTGGVVGTIGAKFLDDGNAAATAKKPIDDMLTTIANLGGGSIDTAVNVDKLTTDITALNTKTTDAKQAAQAFADVLAAFGQSGQQQVNSYISAASADLDHMAKAFKGVGKVAVDAAGNFDVTTKAGQALQTQMVGAQSDIGSVAGAMREAGDSTAAINDRVTQFDNNLEKNLMNDLHLTKGQADALITQFGLWPAQIDTKIGIIDQASPLAKAIGGEINSIPDHTSHITADAIQAGEAVLGLSNQIFGVPDGFFSMYADIDPAQSQINNLVNRNNGRSITLAINAITSGTINAIVGGYRATGGPVMAGRSYLVGEGGHPEIFTPSQNGSISSGSDTASSMSGSSEPRTVEIPIDLSDQLRVVVQAQLDANFRVISQKVKAGVR